MLNQGTGRRKPYINCNMKDRQARLDNLILVGKKALYTSYFPFYGGRG